MEIGLKKVFELKANGLYYRSNGRKAGYYEDSHKAVRITINNIKYSEKDLVYYYHHGYFSDYQLVNTDGDPRNNGILNLLEEGETYVRLNNGIRYDPATKQFMVRKYEENSMRHYYEVIDDYDFM